MDLSVTHNSVAIALDVLPLLACVLLGANRSNMLVAAAFVVGIINTAQIPAVCFIAAIVHPLDNSLSLFEIVGEFPKLYNVGLFLNNVIITTWCIFAARWLRKAQSKPPLNICVFFSLLFILFSVIVLLWRMDILFIFSISFLVSGLLGTLLLVILLLVFFLFTRMSINTETKTCEYSQYIQNLTKRELEVVEAILAGNDSHKKLSTALNISVNTIKTHLKHIYQATGTSNLATLSRLFLGYNPNHP